MRWPGWRRTPAAQPRPFDASVDVDLGHLPQAERRRWVEALARRLEALPGAGWISVEAHPGQGSCVRLFAPGSNVEQVGLDWRGLRDTIGAAVGDALADWSGGWAPAAPEAGGFAEAPAPFAALEQLAALAQQVRPPAPAPAPAAPAASEDAGRLARLLALVLRGDALPPSLSAVHRFGSYAAVLAAPEAELRRVPGLGPHSVAAIKLVHAAAVRLARAGIEARPVLDDRARLQDYLAAALARERIEQFRVLFLDADGMLQADEVQARGTVNHTPVYPREVVRRALALQAASVVLVHNHPSGDPKPSREDLDMTRQVREAAAVMGIALRDHLIVGNGRWLSFRDEGLL